MLSNKIIYQVDAFTDLPFKGNPAGVMILEKPVSEGWMQNMAAEMNLSETAFIIPENEYFKIRYFTPTKEVPLCGHATLASAHVMYQVGLVSEKKAINFKAKAGDLIIENKAGFIAMTFPTYNNNKIETPKNVKTLIGFEPVEFYSSDNGWHIALANHENDIANCNPNFEDLKSNGLGQLMITSKGTIDNVDFVVRCFVPDAGINEDPVTGSAYCALVPLWSNKLGKTEMFSHQISQRGGVLHVNLIDSKVEIKGQAITVFEAKLKI